MNAVLFAVGILLLLAVFIDWYFDPKARQAAEATRREMADDATDRDDKTSREWW
jgi:hypothetical protein